MSAHVHDKIPHYTDSIVCLLLTVKITA